MTSWLDPPSQGLVQHPLGESRRIVCFFTLRSRIILPPTRAFGPFSKHDERIHSGLQQGVETPRITSDPTTIPSDARDRI
jgi:hypothetical protein